MHDSPTPLLHTLDAQLANCVDFIASIYPGISDAPLDVPWSWWVGPDSASTTKQQLETLGFEPDRLLPHMAMETSVDVDRRNPLPRIERITDEGLRDFVTVWAPASGVPTELFEPITEIESHRDGFGTSYVCLGAFLGDELVGSAVVLFAHGVAGIYVVSTRSDHRRQGLGHDITAAAVRLAHELPAFHVPRA
ncbi:GNAT family N-acetyltransferase [Herbiconiux daphne]|uniref:GNAT family N-acetyltransferase n=1 Tax=Herbiconiux daphne TaxID=2970914 RepID=A0ABT2GZU2_9MICO|nr:GNAT family N-acetyltransferase [Herbiconiux daphne]MCS5733381.1 GNAT family N-acetyltransferase [Herbiconiux daphne]